MNLSNAISKRLNGKIFVFTREVGASAYIKDVLEQFDVSSSSIYWACEVGPVNKWAVENSINVWALNSKKEALGILNELQPDLVLLSSTPGDSLEKFILSSARALAIPVVGALDHFWNLWQRFADPITMKKWVYLPDSLIVFDKAVKSRVRTQGARLPVYICPFKVRDAVPPQSTSFEWKRKVGVPEGRPLVAFISENLFRSSKKWKWDQASEDCYRNLGLILLKKISVLEFKGQRPHLIVKKHPAENRDWNKILGGRFKDNYSIIGVTDTAALLESSELIFGLNSQLLIEAVHRGRSVYSFHSDKAYRKNALSSFIKGITELTSEKAVEKVITRKFI